MTDTTHLNSQNLSLSLAYGRLDRDLAKLHAAKTDSERAMRQVWADHSRQEIRDLKAMIRRMDPPELCEMTDEELLATLEV